jgi:3-phenylpropionate/trans-cinnamate dioxygenase ferredoxin component
VADVVAKVGDIPEGEMRAFQVAGEDVNIINVGGTFYAINDECTHAGCSLAEGDLDETTLTCACHGSEFDVTTGDVLGGPATEPVDSYDVTVEGDDIRVDV